MGLEEKVRILENEPLDSLDLEVSDSRGYVVQSNNSASYKRELLLILAGVKPATIIRTDIELLPHSPSDWLSPSWLKIGSYNPDALTFEYNDTWVQKAVDLLRKLGLPHETTSFTYGQADNFCYADGSVSILPNRKIHKVYVGKDQQWLKRIKQADITYDEEELGRCYGYPETAIQSYMKKIPSWSDPRMWGLAGFVLSEQHWKKELETVKLWNDTVKKLSQKIYDQTYSPSHKLIHKLTDS